jgi:2-C-methyl-D-erythritol 2,4-cyclodiphosphate synthase
MRAGIGFDVHRFDESRPLVLGGVTVPGGPGLAGHSDADVLCHAVADALLGAANLGDLGSHFPDRDDRWRDASSVDILRAVGEMVNEHSLVVASIDVTVLLEAPKIASYRDEMRWNVAAALGTDVDRVSVKATTTEGLGTIGRGEGAACMAVALLSEASGA